LQQVAAYQAGDIGGGMRMNQQTLAVRDTVQVSACGRSVEVDMSGARTLIALQRALQTELAMEGQNFEIFSCSGSNIATDGDLQDALSNGHVPLAASLSDSSIHYIENRREELAQMQWKLMRDQLSGVTEKIMQLGRRVGELNESLERQEKETHGSQDRLRHEMTSLVENSKDVTRQSLLQLVERVDAVSHLIHSERNIREASKLGIERQIQGVRDVVESDRSARRTEAAATVSLIEEGRQALMEESRSREAFEDRHTYDMNRLSERIEAMSASNGEKNQDIMEQLKQVAFQTNSAVQEHSRMTFQVRAGAEASQIEAGSRLLKLEDRMAVMEARTMEEKTRQANLLDMINEKHERLWQNIEQCRISERGRGPMIQSVLERCDGIEETMKATEAETRDAVMRERLQRQQELRGTQQTLLAQSAKLYTEMEDKVSTRLERESATRVSVCKQIMDDVQEAMPGVNKVQSQRTVQRLQNGPRTATGGTPMVQVVQSAGGQGMLSASIARSISSPLMLTQQPGSTTMLSGVSTAQGYGRF